MHDFVSWNLSKGKRGMIGADAFFVSFPKSGRSWIRVFYFSYLAHLTGRDFSWEPARFPEYPHLYFTHDRWEHRQSPGWWNFVRGKHLIPPKTRREKKIVLLVRDPRDVVVSLYFHLAKRPHVYDWQPQPLVEMLRDPKFGIRHVIELMNRWLTEWHGHSQFKLMRYEDCKADPAREFHRLLEFIGLTPVDDRAFAAALDFSSFEKMRAGEASGKFQEEGLIAGNRADPDSFKARRGKVGGYHDYFGEAELAYAAEQMRRLDRRLGYANGYDPFMSRECDREMSCRSIPENSA